MKKYAPLETLPTSRSKSDQPEMTGSLFSFRKKLKSHVQLKYCRFRKGHKTPRALETLSTSKLRLDLVLL